MPAPTPSARHQKAAKAVHRCFNYGGVFVGGSPTKQDLCLAYQQGDVVDEVAHMRHFADALLELANAIESDRGASKPDEKAGMSPKNYGVHVLQRMSLDVKKIPNRAEREACEKMLSAELRRQVKDFSDADES